ncbi:hypothetical protein GCM10027084_28960 [Pseudoxanthomonas sangjuensis]|uniref:hypothetical protein n=1 Tax=Pseudoxanthomonas sangjuensis TaxID=1503750 RepID=UPI001390E859|nr:hypothetical protein [Pseudoxanthomonas sangjuensis]
MPPDSPARVARGLSLLLLATGSAIVGALWVLLALRSGRQCSWMALAVALDCAVLLRLGGMRGGWKRATAALLATAVVIALTNWCIVALQVGLPLGLDGWDALVRPGLGYAWTLLDLATGTMDAIFILLALVAAALLGR